MVRPPFHVSQRLITLAVGHWPMVHGEAILRGVDLLALPLDAFCDAVYAWAVRDATVEQRRRFDQALTEPPAQDEFEAGVGEGVGWEDEAEAAEFLAAMHTTNVGGNL